MIGTKGKAVMEEEIILNRRQRNKKESQRKNEKLYKKFKNYIKRDIIKVI